MRICSMHGFSEEENPTYVRPSLLSSCKKEVMKFTDVSWACPVEKCWQLLV